MRTSRTAALAVAALITSQTFRITGERANACSAPSTSSHLRGLLSLPFNRAPVPSAWCGRGVLYQWIQAVSSRRASAKSRKTCYQTHSSRLRKKRLTIPFWSGV